MQSPKTPSRFSPATIWSGYSSAWSSSVATGRISVSTNSRTAPMMSCWTSVRPSVSVSRATAASFGSCGQARLGRERDGRIRPGDLHRAPVVAGAAGDRASLAHVHRGPGPERKLRDPLPRRVAPRQLEAEQGEQRAVHDQAGVALDPGRVVRVVVNPVRVVGQRAEPEEQDRVGDDLNLPGGGTSRPVAPRAAGGTPPRRAPPPRWPGAARRTRPPRAGRSGRPGPA